MPKEAMLRLSGIELISQGRRNLDEQLEGEDQDLVSSEEVWSSPVIYFLHTHFKAVLLVYNCQSEALPCAFWR